MTTIRDIETGHEIGAADTVGGLICVAGWHYGCSRSRISFDDGLDAAGEYQDFLCRDGVPVATLHDGADVAPVPMSEAA